MIASSAGRDHIVSMLIGKGADVNMSNDNGQTSLHYAASRNRLEVHGKSNSFSLTLSLPKCQIMYCFTYC